MIAQNTDNGKLPIEPVFPENWAEQIYDDAPYADEWGVPFDNDNEQRFDEPDIGQHYFEPPTEPIYIDRWTTFPPVAPVTACHAPPVTALCEPVTPVTASHTPPEPSLSGPEKPTMVEYLASLDKWPKWDGVPVQPRPITTSAQLKAMRNKMRIVEHRIRLKARQYAGNVLSFRQIQNVLLQGGCGVGKSTLAVGHKSFFILIAPTTVIINQLASAKCQVIKANVTPDFEKYQQFACTYDSLPRLCQAALEAGYNPYLIPLIIDECQHLLSDGYKGRRLNACMAEVRKFEYVTPTSATIPPLGIPYFEHLSRIVLTRDPRPIKWSYAIGSDAAMTLRCLKQGFGVLLHINNKKKIQIVKEHFEGLGYRVEYIDSDNKDEMMDKGLSDKRLPDADLYLCTSVFNDGISVHEHAKEYIVILSEESTRHLGPNEKVQVAQRFRDYVPAHVYIMRSTDEFDHDSREFLWNDYINSYIARVEQAEKMAVSLTALYHSIKQTQSSETLMSWETHQSAWGKMLPIPEDAYVMFNQEEEAYEPNLRAIGQEVYANLQKACYKSRYMMEYWLGLHDFEYEGIVKVDEETAIEKDLIKTKKNYSKADRQVQHDTIAQFDTYEDALEASRVDVPTTYKQAAKALPFDKFAEGREEEDREELRLEYRQTLKGTVEEAEVKQKAAEIYVEHVQTLCASGVKFQDAVVKAKTDLANSTLTKEALKILKFKSTCEGLVRDSRNPHVAKVDDIAVVSEVLEYMRRQLGKPLDKEATNAVIDHALRHSMSPKGLRPRLTVTPRFPKSKPTSEATARELLKHALMLVKRLSSKKVPKERLAEEKERFKQMEKDELVSWIDQADKDVRARTIEKADKETWRKRMTFLKYFFEMKRSAKRVDGKVYNVWVPTKELHLG